MLKVAKKVSVLKHLLMGALGGGVAGSLGGLSSGARKAAGAATDVEKALGSGVTHSRGNMLRAAFGEGGNKRLADKLLGDTTAGGVKGALGGAALLGGRAALKNRKAVKKAKKIKKTLLLGGGAGAGLLMYKKRKGKTAGEVEKTANLKKSLLKRLAGRKKQVGITVAQAKKHGKLAAGALGVGGAGYLLGGVGKHDKKSHSNKKDK